MSNLDAINTIKIEIGLQKSDKTPDYFDLNFESFKSKLENILETNRSFRATFSNEEHSKMEMNVLNNDRTFIGFQFGDYEIQFHKQRFIAIFKGKLLDWDTFIKPIQQTWRYFCTEKPIEVYLNKLQIDFVFNEKHFDNTDKTKHGVPNLSNYFNNWNPHFNTNPTIKANTKSEYFLKNPITDTSVTGYIISEKLTAVAAFISEQEKTNIVTLVLGITSFAELDQEENLPNEIKTLYSILISKFEELTTSKLKEKLNE